MKIYQFLCSDQTSQESFSEKIFGNKDSYGDDPPQKDDWLILRNYDENVQYGPFKATSDLQRDLADVSWSVHFPWQIRVEWDDLYRLPDSESSFPTSRNIRSLEGREAEGLVEEFRTNGIPIEVTDNGTIDTVEEETEEQDDDSDKPDGEDQNKLRTIIDPVDSESEKTPQEILEEADEPGEVLIEQAVSGELRPALYREALAHLVAGKNLIFYGPPGSGKTRAAERLGKGLTTDLHVETANAEWTHHDLVGGYRPEGEGFRAQEGFLTNQARKCQQSLADHEYPAWIIIDEINRANLDQAFGEVFTLLDMDHRTESQLSYAGGTVKQSMPLSFRILATMNTEDQAQLFSLGYAFRRRFAFIGVPSLFHEEDSFSTKGPTIGEVSLENHVEQVRLIVERAAVSRFEQKAILENDSPLGVPILEEVFDPVDVLDDTVESIRTRDVDFIDVLFLIAQTLDEMDIAEIGQGIIIDAVAYVMVGWFLFPNSGRWNLVDEAVQAYIVPQLDSFTAELRKGQTIASGNDAEERFEEFIRVVDNLGLPQTKQQLKGAMEDYRLI